MSRFTRNFKDLQAGFRQFYVIDAKDAVVGRLASQIAPILQGKNKPIYDMQKHDCGDFVIVINSKYIRFTGHKWKRKIYKSYSFYPGGLKEVPADLAHLKDPTFIIKNAVSKMLPKNHTRDIYLDRLKIFGDEEHDFLGEFLIPLDPIDEDSVRQETQF